MVAHWHMVSVTLQGQVYCRDETENRRADVGSVLICRPLATILPAVPGRLARQLLTKKAYAPLPCLPPHLFPWKDVGVLPLLKMLLLTRYYTVNRL